jgi:hypothetical protein
VNDHCGGRAFSWNINGPHFKTQGTKMYSKEWMAIKAIKAFSEKYLNIKIDNGDIRICRIKKRFL